MNVFTRWRAQQRGRQALPPEVQQRGQTSLRRQLSTPAKKRMTRNGARLRKPERPLLSNCRTAAMPLPPVSLRGSGALPHQSSCVGEWMHFTSPSDLHARLHGEYAGAPWLANLRQFRLSMENDFEREVGSWGVHGGRDGAVIGIVMGGLASIACLALPLVNVSVPLLGVTLAFGLFGLGFLIGFSVQTIIRKHWQMANPETVAAFRQGIANLKEAVAIEASRNPSYDATRDLNDIDNFRRSFEGGLASNFYQVLSAVSGLDVKLILALRRHRRAVAKTAPQQGGEATAPT